MGPFWGFLGSFSPKFGLNLLKFRPDVVYHKRKTFCEQCFKIKCLSTNGTYPNFSVLVHFLGPIYPRKNENIAKNQSFPRNYILRAIQQRKSQVPDKSQNSFKNYQKNRFFGPKMGVNCPLGWNQRVETNCHIAYNRTIHPYFLDP